MTKKLKAAAAIIIILGIAACIFLFIKLNPQNDVSCGDPLKITMLKIGKADTAILQTKNETMVIDAGEEEDGEEITNFLKNQGITRIDTLIITHFDQDHVGGADTLIESMEIGQVLIPAYKGKHTEYIDFMEALNEKTIIPKQLRETMNFNFGEAEVSVEPPSSYKINSDIAENDNNFSLITTITHGKNRLLFTGDAQKQRIKELLEKNSVNPCVFLKMPHHGIYNTALKDLISAVKPKYAVICSSNKNPADPETLELLCENNINTFQTKDGNITAISDKNHLELRQELESQG